MSFLPSMTNEALNSNAGAFWSEFGVQNSNAGAIWPVFEDVFASIGARNETVRAFIAGAHGPDDNTGISCSVTAVQIENRRTISFTDPFRDCFGVSSDRTSEPETRESSAPSRAGRRILATHHGLSVAATVCCFNAEPFRSQSGRDDFDAEPFW